MLSPSRVVLRVVVLGVANGLVDRDDGLSLVLGAGAPQAEPMDPRALRPKTLWEVEAELRHRPKRTSLSGSEVFLGQRAETWPL